VSSSSSTHPLSLRPILSFPMPIAFGLLFVSSPLSVHVFRLELITTSSTRRANEEEKSMIKKNMNVSGCKTAGALLHRDCWRNQDEAVRQRVGHDSRLGTVAHKRAVTTTHRALRKNMLPSPARTNVRREQYNYNNKKTTTTTTTTTTKTTT